MRAVLLVALALLCGCGPSFRDEAEERRYLDALSNPTPDQFQRREALKRSAEARALKAESDRLDALGEAARARLRAEGKAADAKAADVDADARRSWLENAAKWEEAGDREKAAESLDRLISEWPASSEAETARAGLKRLRP